MSRRTINEIEERFQVLADLLRTKVIHPGDNQPGIYIRCHQGRYRVYQNVKKTVSGKDDCIMVGVRFLSDDYLSPTQMYERISTAIDLVVSFGLVPSRIFAEPFQKV